MMLGSAADKILVNIMRLLSITQLNMQMEPTLGTPFLAAKIFEDDRILVCGNHYLLCIVYNIFM